MTPSLPVVAARLRCVYCGFEDERFFSAEDALASSFTPVVSTVRSPSYPLPVASVEVRTVTPGRRFLFWRTRDRVESRRERLVCANCRVGSLKLMSRSPVIPR